MNIINQYGQINTATLQMGCKSFCKPGGPCYTERGRQNYKMMAECITSLRVQ